MTGLADVDIAGWERPEQGGSRASILLSQTSNPKIDDRNGWLWESYRADQAQYWQREAEKNWQDEATRKQNAAAKDWRAEATKLNTKTYKVSRSDPQRVLRAMGAEGLSQNPPRFIMAGSYVAKGLSLPPNKKEILDRFDDPDIDPRVKRAICTDFVLSHIGPIQYPSTGRRLPDGYEIHNGDENEGGGIVNLPGYYIKDADFRWIRDPKNAAAIAEFLSKKISIEVFAGTSIKSAEMAEVAMAHGAPPAMCYVNDIFWPIMTQGIRNTRNAIDPNGGKPLFDKTHKLPGDAVNPEFWHQKEFDEIKRTNFGQDIDGVVVFGLGVSQQNLTEKERGDFFDYAYDLLAPLKKKGIKAQLGLSTDNTTDISELMGAYDHHFYGHFDVQGCIAQCTDIHGMTGMRFIHQGSPAITWRNDIRQAIKARRRIERSTIFCKRDQYLWHKEPSGTNKRRVIFEADRPYLSALRYALNESEQEWEYRKHKFQRHGRLPVRTANPNVNFGFDILEPII